MHLHRHTYTRPHMIHKYTNTHTCTYIYKTYITIYTYTCIFKYRHTHIYYTHMQKHTQIKNYIYIYIYIYIKILKEFYTLSKLLMNENTQFCFDTTRVLCLLTIFRSIFISFLKTKYKIFSKKTKLIEKYIYVIYPFSTNFNSGLL